MSEPSAFRGERATQAPEWSAASIAARSGMTPSFRNTLALFAAAVLAVSFVYTPSTMPKLGVCFFRRVTDLPCPGCGLTRSFCSISHGEFAAAWGFHPFGFAFYALTLTVLVWPLVARRRPELETKILSARATWMSAVVFLLALFAFGGVRLWGLTHAA